jgi:hypothetical protein
MKKETAQSLASALKSIFSQTLVGHNLPLGDSGYYVLATHDNLPIAEKHRFDCKEFSDESEALEMLEF